MNDHSATPSAMPASEAELARRLEDLSATTTLDVDDAWEKIQTRITAGDAHTADRRLPPRLVLVAAAAALVVICGAIVLAQGGEDNGRVRTADQTTTTDNDSPTRRRGSHATTSTVAPGGLGTHANPNQGGGGVADPGSAGSSGGSSGSSATPSGSAGPGAGSTTPPNASGPALPTRVQPTMVLDSSDYTVEIVYDATYEMFYFRRTDDVDSVYEGPDAYGHSVATGWGHVTGPICLTSSGGDHHYSDAAPHAFDYGLVGGAVQSIVVVMRDGRRVAAPIGPDVGTGMRAWLVERPRGDVAHFEGRDTSGNVVVTLTAYPDGTTSSDYGMSQC